MREYFKREYERLVPRSRWLWVVALTAAVALPGAAQPGVKELRAAVDKALAPGVKGDAAVAVVVVDALTGRTLLATPNADDAFTPASNMKLLTTATTLNHYGPDHALTTTLAVSGDDLLVIGGGDPALGDPALAERDGRTPMSVFDDWAEALKKAKITEVAGDLVVIDAVFDEQLTHPTWGSANELQWYGAPVAGVNFNDNCVDFTFVPNPGGGPAVVRTVPPGGGGFGGFVVRGKVKTVADVDQHSPVLDKRPQPIDGRSTYVVKGAVAREAGPYSKPVDDPRLFFGEALKAALAERGIAVSGGVRVERALPERGMRQIATHRTPLPDVLGRVNTNSQNMMAEALAKLNGLAYDQAQDVEDARGSWGSGHLAAVAFLKEIGVDAVVVTSADGSGLSRENRLSARVVSGLLMHMLTEHEHGEHLLDSMAISGVRGSVKNRMKDLEGRVYAKTGTIRGVSALSGFVFAENGNVAVFSILHNGIKGGASPYRKQQDAAAEAIAAWLEAQPAVEVEDPEVLEAMRQVGLIGAGAE